MSAKRETVVVAMSGGVDSSVAAGLLVREGHDVIGATLELRACTDDSDARWCCGTGATAQARAVAGVLGIKHYAVPCADTFADRVLRPAWEEYSRGRTPSPCVLCNRHLKFELLLERSRALGATRVATGHYARITRDAEGNPELRRGRDPDRDQSYFLHALDAEQLARARFPLGELDKRAVRGLAAEMGFANAERPASQDACFMAPDGSFAEGLRQLFDAPAQPGRIVDHRGAELGSHPGIHHYTVGQRRGLGVALGRRAYVARIDAASGTVVLSDDPAELEHDALSASGVTWCGPRPALPRPVEAQIRYRHRAVKALLDELAPDRIVLELEEPERAIAPGQAVVFYEGDRVLGGGWIDGGGTAPPESETSGDH
jgi:tRNA-specific 2-thiouridylase